MNEGKDAMQIWGSQPSQGGDDTGARREREQSITYSGLRQGTSTMWCATRGVVSQLRSMISKSQTAR